MTSCQHISETSPPLFRVAIDSIQIDCCRNCANSFSSRFKKTKGFKVVDLRPKFSPAPAPSSTIKLPSDIPFPADVCSAQVYAGSDGELTKSFYAAMLQKGPIGIIAMNLFRAQKASTRAKVYRGGIRGEGSFRSMAYDKKNFSLRELAKALVAHGEKLEIFWGWKEDLDTPGFTWVLYVELPWFGQVSFHSKVKGEGPEYPREWDGKHESAERILRFCDKVLGRENGNGSRQ